MSQSDICFYSHAGIITQANNQRPCTSTANGPSSCCVIGDICEGDNICHFTHPGSVLGASYSTYYMGGCTEISYGNSTVCTPHCTTSDSSSAGSQTDVTYITANNQWACCGATVNGPHCDVPTDEVFQALAPSAMTNTAIVLSTGFPSNSPPTTSPSSTNPASTTPTSSTTPTPSSPQSTDSSLPSSTKIGIGIGVGIAVIALITLIALLFFFRHRHKKKLLAARYSQSGSASRRSQPGSTYGVTPSSHQGILMGYMDHRGKNAVKPLEEPASWRPELGEREENLIEMDGRGRPMEMDARTRVR